MMRMSDAALRQTRGPLGALVERLLRSGVRRGFHTVWWRPPMEPLPRPSVLVANHHGWFDGHLLFLAVRRLGIPTVLWVERLREFPFFAAVGAMPFPKEEPAQRAATIRRTVRWMRQGGCLALFPEGELHRPPDLLPMGRSLGLLQRLVPEAPLVPVAIRYEMGIHQRPEAWLSFGAPQEPCGIAASLGSMLADRGLAGFEVLARGTPDDDEKWRLPLLRGRR